MNDQARLTIIDRLRAQSGEQEWFEFKRNYYEPQALGEYISALANAAALARQPRGYLIFGIDDESHDVVGTSFEPYTATAKGNQALLPWLFAGLRPYVGVETNEVLVPKLPDRLTASQKRRRVRYLLQQLRLSGNIVNRGTRSRPAWVLSRNVQSSLDKHG